LVRTWHPVLHLLA